MHFPLLIETRAKTMALCSVLTVEDHLIQTIEDVSPPKWHLAHTTWFFEEFLLKKYIKNYSPFHPQFGYLFNSYYQGMGKHLPRNRRGSISHPSLSQIHVYRKHVDNHLSILWEDSLVWNGNDGEKKRQTFLMLLSLGIQHEKQHQELLLTDIKYNFYQNPLYPSYHSSSLPPEQKQEYIALDYLEVPRGQYSIGCKSETDFFYDNESPQHYVYCHDFRIGNRLITCGEFLDFIEDGGYTNFRYWMSDGWDWVQKERCHAPLYWQKDETSWSVYRLSGFDRLQKEEPVCHLSYYEASAYAHWAGKRLPTEIEWEVATEQLVTPCVLKSAHFADQKILHPLPATENKKLSISANSFTQCLGELWEWTNSAYQPYPGYCPFPGMLEEYNEKFMCNQIVLRGGSCVSPENHIRIAYRNFLQAAKCWQFSGLRLAQSI